MAFRILVTTFLVVSAAAFAPHKPGFLARAMKNANKRPTVLYNAIEDEMILEDAEERMKKCCTSMQANLDTVRTGRANPRMLDRVFVNYYDTPTPLNQVATVTTSSQTITIDPFDKSAIKDVERAIIESDLGMSPSNDGTKIRLNVPPLTEDRRKEFVKVAKGLGEDGKVSIRNVRRDVVDQVKKLAKDKELKLSEDNVKDAEDSIQKMTDAAIKKVDELVAAKEKEILKV